MKTTATTATKYGDSVLILDLVDQEQRREFEDLVWPNPGDTPLDRPLHVARILQLAEQCRTAVVESEYVDTDHRLSYSRLYNLRHADTPRRCTRIHLFSCTLSPNELDDVSKEISEHYRGFLVIRPLSTDRLGRTLLSPELFKEVDEFEVYLTCRARYEVSLVGNTISFVGVPWMEQEKLVSRCASAALWMASWHLSHRFRPEFRLFYTPEITDLATEALLTNGRGMPSMLGLSIDQMMYALRGMGYEPLLYRPTSAADAKSTVYAYVESGLPVFVHLRINSNGSRLGHVVVAMGHSFEAKMHSSDPGTPRSEEENELVVHSTSDFVPSFVVQDDSWGPFRLLEFIDSCALAKGANLDPGVNHPIGLLKIEVDGELQNIPGYVESLLVALPPGVVLEAHSAEYRARAFLTDWVRRSNDFPPGEIVLRTFLQPSSELKKSWRRIRKVDRKLARLLRSYPMSRWVWITEVALIEGLRDRHEIIGQILQDSASHEDDLLLLHLPGRLQWRDPRGRHREVAIKPVPIPRFERED